VLIRAFYAPGLDKTKPISPADLADDVKPLAPDPVLKDVMTEFERQLLQAELEQMVDRKILFHVLF
jgi:hypothetical protein